MVLGDEGVLLVLVPGLDEEAGKHRRPKHKNHNDEDVECRRDVGGRRAEASL